MKTKVKVTYFNDGGKFYQKLSFKTNTPSYETGLINQEIEERFAFFDKDYVFVAKTKSDTSGNELFNSRLVIKSK